jgi:hypothetical protein
MTAAASGKNPTEALRVSYSLVSESGGDQGLLELMIQSKTVLDHLELDGKFQT